MSLAYAVDRVRDGDLIGDVENHRFAIRLCGNGLRIVDVRAHNVSARRRQSSSGRTPNTRGCAGNQCQFAIEPKLLHKLQL